MSLTLDDNHVYRWNNAIVPGVTSVLGDLGFYPPYVGSGPREMGTAIHKMIELYNGGELDEAETSQELIPYLNAYRLFLGDVCPTLVDGESMLYSVAHGFAGTVDLVFDVAGGGIENERWIVDLKRTSGDPPPCTGMQLSAYGLLSGGENRRYFALRLMPNGKYKLIEYADESADFLAALRVWKRLKKEGRMSK